MRFYGNLRKSIPLTFAAMTIGTLSLTGFFFTSGYYSKDAIIEAAFANGSEASMVAFAVGVLVALLTSFYSWRLVFLTFFGEARWGASEHIQHALHPDAHDHDTEDTTDSDHAPHAPAPAGTGGYHPHESPWTMLLPLAVLSVGALLAGWAFHDRFLGPEGAVAFWNGSAVVRPALAEAMERIPVWVAWTPAAAFFLGLGLAWLAYVRDRDLPARFVASNRGLYAFLTHKWYFDELYDTVFVRPAFAIGRLFWKRGDAGLIDRFGPDGVSAVVASGAGLAKRFQSGLVYSYALVMLIGLAAGATWVLAPLMAGR